MCCDYLDKHDEHIDNVYASSWLMDVPAVLYKTGFEVIRKKPFTAEVTDISKITNFPFGIELWGQFIDDNGNFKKKELLYLFEKGVPRYKQTEVKISLEKLSEMCNN